MENALEPEITAFRHDLHKMEASVRRLIMVANNQLKKVSQSSKACLLCSIYIIKLMPQNKNLREKEMKDVGQAFCEMGFAIKEERPIFVKIGMNYDASVRLWNSHIIEEWQPIFELLLEYRALLKGWHSLIGKIKQRNSKKWIVPDDDDDKNILF